MDFLITFLASFLIWILYLGLVIVGVRGGKTNRGIVIRALLASFGAWVIAEIIKSLLPSTRPFLVTGTPIFTVTTPFDNSFPSGHTALAFGLATAVWLKNRKIGYLFIVGAMLVGIGRVLANVHYGLDVSIGALIGILVALFVKKVRLPLDY